MRTEMNTGMGQMNTLWDPGVQYICFLATEKLRYLMILVFVDNSPLSLDTRT